MEYLKHRLRRLPGTPENIGRGIAVGIFVTFTPFFGLHFFVAAMVAYLVRGNVLASLLSTFFGNPVTFPIIALINMQIGRWMFGIDPAAPGHKSIISQFLAAGGDLWHNILAIFGPQHAHWGGINRFYFDIFLPYSIGGILPGLVCAGIAYYLSVPLIRAYQKSPSQKVDASGGTAQ